MLRVAERVRFCKKVDRALMERTGALNPFTLPKRGVSAAYPHRHVIGLEAAGDRRWLADRLVELRHKARRIGVAMEYAKFSEWALARRRPFA
jgi:hypothetical protein